MSLKADIIECLHTEIPGFSKRPFTLTDFETLIQKYNIHVLYKKLPCNGLICQIEDMPFILLNNRLYAGHRVFVGYHELFHYYFHSYGIHFYRSLGRQSWAESQASTMTSLALIPTPSLKDDLASDYNMWSFAEKYDLTKYL